MKGYQTLEFTELTEVNTVQECSYFPSFAWLQFMCSFFNTHLGNESVSQTHRVHAYISDHIITLQRLSHTQKKADQSEALLKEAG